MEEERLGVAIALRAVCWAPSANSRRYFEKELKTHPQVPREEEGAADQALTLGSVCLVSDQDTKASHRTTTGLSGG